MRRYGIALLPWARVARPPESDHGHTRARCSRRLGALSAAGDFESVEQTLVFSQSASGANAPLYSGRYRR